MLRTVCSLVLAGLLVVAFSGCAKEEEKKPPTPPKGETPKVDTPKVDTPKVDTPKVDTPKVDTPKVDTPKVDTPKVDTPKVDTSAATQEAQGLLDKVQEYIKDKKWDDAEAALKKLEAMSDKLPAEWKSKITAARSALTAAKGASALPTLPGGK